MSPNKKNITVYPEKDVVLPPEAEGLSQAEQDALRKDTAQLASLIDIERFNAVAESNARKLLETGKVNADAQVADLPIIRHAMDTKRKLPIFEWLLSHSTDPNQCSAPNEHIMFHADRARFVRAIVADARVNLLVRNAAGEDAMDILIRDMKDGLGSGDFKRASLLAGAGVPLPESARDMERFAPHYAQWDARFSAWDAAPLDPSQLTPELVRGFSSIGKLRATFDPQRWSGHEHDALAIIGQQPEWFRNQIPDIIAELALCAPGTVVGDAHHASTKGVSSNARG